MPKPYEDRIDLWRIASSGVGYAAEVIRNLSDSQSMTRPADLLYGDFEKARQSATRALREIKKAQAIVRRALKKK